ncbi:hypothetical protein [Actinoplanes derwentensis]|uniref:hypothetical protein n=1 Tax=Actinoplanes derwentensis TaxID=113562 RepID=UPI0012FE7DAA|nr:hypothetical protein [Actinoplanes derwentensis]GID84072.1 hypothetical protein Ade03nite_29960 [Actinoplanes derwentensis]
MDIQHEEPLPFADRGKAASSEAADLVHGDGASPSPIRDRHWDDEEGIRWHMSGRPIEAYPAAVRRQLQRTGLHVLYADGSAPREVFGEQRRALIERVQRSVVSGAEPPSDFSLADFRTGDHRVMLVIEEVY